MALAFYQGTKVYGTTNLSLTTQAGALLVAWVAGQGSCSTTTVSGGGTWATGLTAMGPSNQSYARMYYCLSATGGSSTFALANGPSDGGWLIKEFRGATTWALGKTNQHVGAGDASNYTARTSGTVTPDAHTSEVLVGAFGNETNNFTSWDAGWTDADSNSGHYDSFTDRIVTPPSGAYEASLTCSSQHDYYCIQIATFYDSGASGNIYNMVTNLSATNTFNDNPLNNIFGAKTNLSAGHSFSNTPKNCIYGAGVSFAATNSFGDIPNANRNVAVPLSATNSFIPSGRASFVNGVVVNLVASNTLSDSANKSSIVNTNLAATGSFSVIPNANMNTTFLMSAVNSLTLSSSASYNVDAALSAVLSFLSSYTWTGAGGGTVYTDIVTLSAIYSLTQDSQSVFNAIAAFNATQSVSENANASFAAISNLSATQSMTDSANASFSAKSNLSATRATSQGATTTFLAESDLSALSSISTGVTGTFLGQSDLAVVLNFTGNAIGQYNVSTVISALATFVSNWKVPGVAPQIIFLTDGRIVILLNPTLGLPL